MIVIFNWPSSAPLKQKFWACMAAPQAKLARPWLWHACMHKFLGPSDPGLLFFCFTLSFLINPVIRLELVPVGDFFCKSLRIPWGHGKICSSCPSTPYLKRCRRPLRTISLIFLILLLSSASCSSCYSLSHIRGPRLVPTQRGPLLYSPLASCKRIVCKWSLDLRQLHQFECTTNEVI